MNYGLIFAIVSLLAIQMLLVCASAFAFSRIFPLFSIGPRLDQMQRELAEKKLPVTRVEERVDNLDKDIRDARKELESHRGRLTSLARWVKDLRAGQRDDDEDTQELPAVSDYPAPPSYPPANLTNGRPGGLPSHFGRKVD